MKQKLKDLLKKKPVRATIDEMMIDPAFTVLTDEQKAGKKAGITADSLSRNSFENSHFGLVNNSIFNPVNNNLGGGSNNSLSSGRFKIVDGIPIAWGGPDVIIRDTRINKPTSPQFPNFPKFPTHPNIPYWDTPPTVVNPYVPPVKTVPSPAPVPDVNFKYERSITPHDAIQNTTVGANKTDFFEDEEARKRSEKYKHLTMKYWDSSAFETTAERSDYYRWVNKQLEGKSKWFGAAAIVAEAYAVGATEGLNGPFLNNAAKTLLKEGSEKLFSRNKWEAYYMIYQDRMHNLGFDDGNGIGVSFKGKKREDLDYTLVKYEQTRLNLILSEYKKKNPISEVNSAIRSINEVMRSPRASQEVRQVMSEQFNVEEGQKAFDFDNYEHRVKLGQGVVDKLYEYDNKVALSITEPALSKMEQLVNQDVYMVHEQHLESDYLRTAETPEALKKMDTSEFMNRYLKEIGVFNKVPNFNWLDYKHLDEKKFDNKLQKVGSRRFVPQVGDIYTDTHEYSGIVKSYDKTTDTITSLVYDEDHSLVGSRLGKITEDTRRRAYITETRTYYRPVTPPIASTPSIALPEPNNKIVLGATPPSSTKIDPVKKVEPIATTPSVKIPDAKSKVVPGVTKPDLAPSSPIALPPVVETGSMNKTTPISQAPSSHVADPKHVFTLHVRSYEHSKEFGAPLLSKGDGREASTSTGREVTSRINYKLDIDTKENRFVDHKAISDKSELLIDRVLPIANPKDKADPIWHTHTDGKGAYTFTVAAADPIFDKMPVVTLATPDINIKGTMNVTEHNGVLNIKGNIKGDAFPDAETFIKDNSGQALMLGTYYHGKLASPLTDLAGDGNKPMIDVNVQVELNKDGNFSKAWAVDAKGIKTALPIVALDKN